MLLNITQVLSKCKPTDMPTSIATDMDVISNCSGHVCKYLTMTSDLCLLDIFSD
jgi:hypothetical protein